MTKKSDSGEHWEISAFSVPSSQLVVPSVFSLSPAVVFPIINVNSCHFYIMFAGVCIWLANGLCHSDKFTILDVFRHKAISPSVDLTKSLHMLCCTLNGGYIRITDNLQGTR